MARRRPVPYAIAYSSSPSRYGELDMDGERYDADNTRPGRMAAWWSRSSPGELDNGDEPREGGDRPIQYGVDEGSPPKE